MPADRLGMTSVSKQTLQMLKLFTLVVSMFGNQAMVEQAGVSMVIGMAAVALLMYTLIFTVCTSFQALAGY